MSGRPWLTTKYWKRRLRKARNAAASRFFNTRFGRRLLIENIGPRVVSMTVDAGDHLMTFSPSAMNRPSAGSRLRRSSTSVRPV